MDVSIKDLSKKLEEFAKGRDWEKYHSPRNLTLAMERRNPIPYLRKNELDATKFHKSLVTKRLENYQKYSNGGLRSNWEESDKEHLGEQLFDVLLYLIRLADICGIDLGDAASQKIVKNAIKYPPKVLIESMLYFFHQFCFLGLKKLALQ